MVQRTRFDAPVVRVLSIASAFVSPGNAAPLGEEAKTFIEERLSHASVLSNASRALALCREAEARAGSYEPDPFYDGAIAHCIAYSELHLKNGPTACKQMLRALESLQRVRRGHPKRSEAVELVGSIRRDRSRFGC
jgi:hypothetical protein